MAAALAVVLSGGVAWSAPPLTAQQQMELDTLKTQLADATRAAKTKHEAALLLLTRPYPQAAAVAAEFLADASNRPAQIAIANAIAQSAQTDKAFVKPLLAMLTGAEPAVRAPAAGALAAYKDNGVVDAFARLVGDPKTDRAVRLAIIASMQRMLDKKAITALIGLLRDRDVAIRNAACDTLANLTNIRHFGHDPARWRRWWNRSKDKPQSEWLADLADRLARANLDLQRRNGELRKRLAAAMSDLYAATPAAGRDDLLVGMLKDPLSEVRLMGLKLTRQRLTGQQAAPEPLAVQVAARVTDDEPAVRREAILLLGRVRPTQAGAILAERVGAEKSPEALAAVYQALGSRRDAGVWDLLVGGIGANDASVAASAAAGLGRVAANNNLSQGRRDAAVKALTGRYARSGGEDLAPLREALLGAMGAMKDARLDALMTSALTDSAAAVRLGAIKGLVARQVARRAEAIVPLIKDADRGVRLAAISAVGALGGMDHLEAILAGADASVESDAAVRQQAWSVVMGLLPKADADRLGALADDLAKQADDTGRLIDVLKLWAGKVPADKPDRWMPVRLRLGEALLSADRPAEAVGELAAVHAAMVKAQHQQAGAVWMKWINALLAAGDTSVAARIAETKDAQAFKAAVEALFKRLDALDGAKDWLGTIQLAGTAQQRLGPRLNNAQRAVLDTALAEARRRQRQADAQRVATLAGALTGADAGARDAAAKELAAMKDRAALPLAEHLLKAVTDAKPNAAEKALFQALVALAPQLTGYDPNAPAKQRADTVAAWIRKLGA